MMRTPFAMLIACLLALTAIAAPSLAQDAGTPAAGTPAAGMPAPDENGLITIESAYSVVETMDRLEAAVEENDLIVVARVDHAVNAEGVGEDLRPTQLLIFGNPMVGTVFMQEQQSIGIDLPQKFLAWEDADGTVWLTWNDAAWVAERHGITDADETIQMVTQAQQMLAMNATA